MEANGSIAAVSASRRLPALVFVVGAAALGVEIAAVRLLAPYFGASEVVWANTIGVVLVALSAGYWLGGRIADRRPRMRDLCATVMLAAVLTALLPFVAKPLLNTGVDALESIQAGAFVGSLLATLALIAVPVLVMGTVAPWALRIGIDAVGPARAGALAGRLYAVSTAGSLVGTLLAALVLVPGIGTRRTFLVFALALALSALLGAAPRHGRAAVAASIAALLLLAPAGGVKSKTTAGTVVHEQETRHQYLRVIERADGSRVLELNEGQAIHSLYRPGTALTGDYWDTALVLPLSAIGDTPRSIAVLGNAAGTIARAYARYYPRTEVTGVEIDERLVAVGRRWFGLRGDRFTAVAADARPFLRETGDRFDVIVLDAYRQPYIPFYLTTREFFALARRRLTSRGVVIVNVGHPEDSDELENVLAATMRTAFDHVSLSHTQPTNTMIVASNAPIQPLAMAERAAAVDRDLSPIAAREAALLRPAPPGGRVFTDDRAPVEWLIDRSIVEYAAGD